MNTLVTVNNIIVVLLAALLNVDLFLSWSETKIKDLYRVCL